MEIPPNLRPVDPATRKRPAEAGTRTPVGAQPTVRATGDAVTTSGEREAVARYAALAERYAGDPERLAELQRQLADGTFTASPEELADRLLGDGPAR